MKKYTLAAVAAVSLLALGSCIKDHENSMESNTPIISYNLLTPVSGEGEAYVRLNKYSVAMKWPDQTIALSSPSLSLPSGATTSFTTVPLPASQEVVFIGDKGYEAIQFAASDASSDGARVTDLKGVLAQSAYIPPLLSTGINTGSSGQEGTIDFDKTFPLFIPGNSNHYAVIQYTLNNTWKVRTFWPDVTFRGSTVTSYPGMTEPYENTEMSYRVIMKLKDNLPTDKADVIFYNAKFAPPAPEVTVVLKDLDLKFTDKGYTIAGNNIIPQMYMDQVLADNPKYKFNAFNLSVSGDLTGANIEYTVADVFHGSFTGRYIKLP